MGSNPTPGTNAPEHETARAGQSRALFPCRRERRAGSGPAGLRIYDPGIHQAALIGTFTMGPILMMGVLKLARDYWPSAQPPDQAMTSRPPTNV